MDSYREGCVKHKMVQRGIAEPRPVSANKNRSEEHRWLVVYHYPFSLSKNWRPWNKQGYKTEEEALRVANKHGGYRAYIVDREVFDRCYKNTCF